MSIPILRRHHPQAAEPPDNDPRRWRILGLLSLAELLGMSIWFAASAVAAQLGARWNLSVSEIGWLTAIVQLGFVVGTATSALLNLADIVPARRLFADFRVGRCGCQHASPFRAEVRSCSGVPLRDRVCARRRISAGDEDDLDVVSESARSWR